MTWARLADERVQRARAETQWIAFKQRALGNQGLYILGAASQGDGESAWEG